MKITDIPFNRYISLQPPEAGGSIMSLRYSPEMTNHIGTMHASAQFALAEACSGQFMIAAFPGHIAGHIALLRKSEVKFKQPTKTDIFAEASCGEDDIAEFKARLARKHRSFLPIQVTVKDIDGTITMQGTFEWYIQRAGQNDRHGLDRPAG